MQLSLGLVLKGFRVFLETGACNYNKCGVENLAATSLSFSGLAVEHSLLLHSLLCAVCVSVDMWSRNAHHHILPCW